MLLACRVMPCIPISLFDFADYQNVISSTDVVSNADFKFQEFLAVNVRQAAKQSMLDWTAYHWQLLQKPGLWLLPP